MASNSSYLRVEGNMLREEGTVMKSWNPRAVVLQNGSLEFFSKNHKDHSKGSIQLKGFSISKGNTDSRIILRKDKRGMLGGGQDIELVIINDEKNRNENLTPMWIEAIQFHIEYANTGCFPIDKSSSKAAIAEGIPATITKTENSSASNTGSIENQLKQVSLSSSTSIPSIQSNNDTTNNRHDDNAKYVGAITVTAAVATVSAAGIAVNDSNLNGTSGTVDKSQASTTCQPETQPIITGKSDIQNSLTNNNQPNMQPEANLNSLKENNNDEENREDNNNNKLNTDSSINTTTLEIPYLKSNPKEWFQFFDTNQSGRFTYDEILEHLLKTYLVLDRNDADRILNALWKLYQFEPNYSIPLGKFIERDGFAQAIVSQMPQQTSHLQSKAHVISPSILPSDSPVIIPVNWQNFSSSNLAATVVPSAVPNSTSNQTTSAPLWGSNSSVSSAIPSPQTAPPSYPTPVGAYSAVPSAVPNPTAYSPASAPSYPTPIGAYSAVPNPAAYSAPTKPSYPTPVGAYSAVPNPATYSAPTKPSYPTPVGAYSAVPSAVPNPATYSPAVPPSYPTPVGAYSAVPSAVPNPAACSAPTKPSYPTPVGAYSAVPSAVPNPATYSPAVPPSYPTPVGAYSAVPSAVPNPAAYSAPTKPSYPTPVGAYSAVPSAVPNPATYTAPSAVPSWGNSYVTPPAAYSQVPTAAHQGYNFATSSNTSAMYPNSSTGAYSAPSISNYNISTNAVYAEATVAIPIATIIDTNHTTNSFNANYENRSAGNLPANWEEKVTPDGKIFYIDHSTKITTWNRPVTQNSLPANWEEKVTPDGKIFYIDHSTKTTTWNRPN